MFPGPNRGRNAGERRPTRRTDRGTPRLVSGRCGARRSGSVPPATPAWLRRAALSSGDKRWGGRPGLHGPLGLRYSTTCRADRADPGGRSPTGDKGRLHDRQYDNGSRKRTAVGNRMRIPRGGAKRSPWYMYMYIAKLRNPPHRIRRQGNRIQHQNRQAAKVGTAGNHSGSSAPPKG